MTAQQQALYSERQQMIQDITDIRRGLTPAFQGAINALPDWVPGPAVDYAVRKGNEAIHAFDAEAGKAQQFCQDACNNIRECENIREAATAYAEIDFLPSMIATSPGEIAGDIRDGWVSPNSDEYLARLEEMSKKVTRLQTSVTSLTRSLEQLADAMESRDVDLAITVAGLAITVAGLVTTLIVGFTGVGGIIGVALTVLGLVVGLIGLWRLAKTVPARLEECRDEVRTNAFTVGSDPWPRPPRLTAADW